MSSGAPAEVWVTGLGLITPLGVGTEGTWRALCEGRSGVRAVQGFDASGCTSRIAAEMPEEFDREIESLYPRRFKRMTKRYARYAMAAAQMALSDAGFGDGHFDRRKTAVYLGTGTSGYDNERTASDDGIELPGIWDVLKRMPSGVAALISVEHCLEGPAFSLSAACASGGYALGLACDAIRSGRCSAALAGGYDFAVTPGALHGFGMMMVLSEHNEDPARACRPFDRTRDGMVLGDGAGMLVLESAAHARRRRARPHARLAGYATTSEASSLVAPAGKGAGMARTMRRALHDACCAPEQIDYVNAHGTGTVVNDACETRAIRAAFGARADRLAVSSQKCMLGHSLGASGAIEAVVSVLALRDQVAPPTTNAAEPDPECDLDYVREGPRPCRLRGAISNSFAFGGHNCSVIFTADVS